MIISSKVLSGLTVLCLATAAVVLTTRPVQAQGGGGTKITDVRVVNSPLVQVVPVKQPFNLSTQIHFANGEFFAQGTGNTFIDIPAGKVLVVESIHVFSEADDFSLYALSNQSQNEGFAFVGSSGLSNGIHVTNALVNARILGPETTSMNVRRTGNTGVATVFIIVNGYFEPAP